MVDENNRLDREEMFWLAIMRLNRLLKRKEIDKTWTIGRVRVRFNWRSASNLWGRFGGGWNWKFGFQIGGRTVIFNLLVCSVTISLVPRERRQAAHDEEG